MDNSNWDGKIYTIVMREYCIHCVNCKNFDSWVNDSFYNINDAIKYFRSEGWKKIKGKWHCKGCTKK